MLCKNCGKEIFENQAFCTNCGAPVEKPAQEVTEIEAEPIANEEPAVVEDAATESFDINTYDESESLVYDEVVAPAKKKKTGLIIGLASAAVVVALAVLVGFNFNLVKGYAIKTFGSDTDYLRFVEGQSLQQSIDGITEVYGVAMEEKQDSSATVKLQPKLGDRAEELIGENLTGEMDLDWINKLSLSATSEMGKDKAAVDLVLALSNSEVLKLDAITDMEQQALYFAISNLSDKYIKTDIELDESVAIGEGGMSKIMEALDDPEFKEILPSEKELNELLKKYTDIVIDSIEAKEISTMYLTVGDVAGEYTVIEYEITEEDALAIAEKLLNAAKEDTELKEIIESACGYLADKEIIDPDIDYYDEFQEFIDEGLDAVEEAMDDADDNDPITIKNFINSKHEICGRTVEVDGDEMFNYITVWKGTKFATEVEFDNVKVEGSGEVKGTKLNAEYTVKVDKSKYLDIIIEEADVIAISDKKFNGTVRVELSDTFVEEMGDSEFADLMEEYDFAFELKIAAEEKTSKLEVNVLSKRDLFVGFDITTTLNESDGKITTPSDAIDATDEEELTQWAESLDLTKIVDALEKGGLDEDLVTAVESYLDQLKAMMDPDSYYDDYYSDSYDDYYSDSYDDVYGDIGYRDPSYSENVYAY